MKPPRATLKQLQQQLDISKIKDRRLKIMWNSNAVWANSGYGVEQRDLLYRLVKDGWPVAQIAFTGLEGSPIIINGLMVYPKMADTWGSDAIIHHSRHWQANAVFCMQDIFLLDSNALRTLGQNKIPFIPWVPIDQEPAPPGVLEKLNLAYKIITFSKFGQKALQKKGFTSTLILEGTDCEIFNIRDKIEARKRLNWPQDKFIFGMIGANKENPPRKGWQEALEAFKLFFDKHPDSLFFIHSNQWAGTGFPILHYANYLGIDKQIISMDGYLATFHTSSNDISLIINAIDCLLHPSMTEGFGLSIIEAQASGVPVIVNNCTSMPELVVEGITGEICDTDKRIFSNQLGFVYFANVNSLYDKMEKVFKNTPSFYSQAARDHIIKNYNINTLVHEQWIPFLEELQLELLGPNPLQKKLEGV